MALKTSSSRLVRTLDKETIDELDKALKTKAGVTIMEAIILLLEKSMEESQKTYLEDLKNPAYPFIRAFYDGRVTEAKELKQLFE